MNPPPRLNTRDDGALRAARIGACAVAALLAVTGCANDPRSPAAPPPVTDVPWSTSNAPAELLQLADDLQAYQAVANRLPASLADLDQSHLGVGGPYATRDYAYHPASVGLLPGGWRVLLADDRLRDANGVWCILRTPVRVSGLSPLRVAQVGIDDLRAAAPQPDLR